MATSVIDISIKRKQNRIMQVLKNLESYPQVSVHPETKDGCINVIWIEHQKQFVPNFKFEWDSKKEQYRVYIWVANTTTCVKEHVGYPICVIGTGLVAMGFGTLYSFLYKHRANKKQEDVCSIAA